MSAPSVPALESARWKPRARAFFELTKPRITTLVVFTALVGYVSASGRNIDPLGALLALCGTALVASGASALNMVLERETDARMLRTRTRPIPSGRLRPGEATAFGIVVTLLGLLWLGLGSGTLPALVSFATWASYLFAYTPLKRVTSLATIVGAVPGALPPLIGWTAARGSLDFGGWLLVAIVFVWQIPHFLAIAWLYRDDYALGGIRTLCSVDPGGRTCGRQALVYALVLGPVSLLPQLAGLAGWAYLIGALVLGLAVGLAALRFALDRTERSARILFLASVVYLAALCVLLIIDRTI